MPIDKSTLLKKSIAKAIQSPGNMVSGAVCLAASLMILVLRGFEFHVLHCRWYDDAYASIVWLLLGLHTTHLVTDTWDTGVLLALAAKGPFETNRFVDVSENALYWIFVVLSWLPIYAVIYWAPRSV